nr:SHOCT domain-containing protein [Moritella viscosa]
MSPIERVNESKSHFEDAVFKGKDFYISEKQYEGDQYRIFHQASTGFSGTGGIRRSATKRADDFCRNQSEETKMFKLSEHTASPPYILGNFPRIEIIFTCITKDKVIRNNENKYDQLSKIKLLYDNGTLTESEFLKEKVKLLK